MPIGKNALKRVTNNGYSKVAVSAPDMEHSEPVASVEEPKEVIKETTTQAAPKKSSEPKAKKPATPKSVAKKVQDVSRPDGFVRYGLGSDLPTHLL